MIPPDALILLDTNVLIHLVRGKELGQRIDADFALASSARSSPLSPLVRRSP
jgi:predicted nucleic acid-binding protein